jgi:hypothetical protein
MKSQMIIFLPKASKNKLNPWNKSFVKQIHHKFKTNNVRTLKVQKASFRKPSWLFKAKNDIFLPKA